MFLTRECEMGIRAVLHLAVHGAQEGMSTEEIAEAQHLSSGYLARAFERMVKARVLEKRADGRYRLSQPAERITLRALVESFSGSLELTRCLCHHEQIHPCGEEGHCGLFALWKELQASVLRTMESRTLADMVERVPKTVAP